MLLAMGQTAYFGPAIDSLEHFARLGHEPDGLVNPADYLLEVRLGHPRPLSHARSKQNIEAST